MSGFFNIGDDMFNLEHVVSVQYVSEDNYTVTMSDGSRYEADYGDVCSLEKIIDPVVPSRPGDTAYVVRYWTGTAEVEPGHSITELPIAAWRIMWDIAEPVFVDLVDDTYEIVGIPIQDGKVCVQHHHTYDSKQEFVEASLRQLRLSAEYRKKSLEDERASEADEEAP